MRIVTSRLICGIAAALLTAGCAGPQANLSMALQPPGAAKPVAAIIDAKDAVWEATPPPADRYAPRQVEYLRLRSGVATVKFNSGVAVTLTGPCEFGVLSHSRGELRQGALTAAVPEGAHGFTVGLPGAVITGLGGEFHAAIEADGGASVKVIKGFAEFVPEGQKPTVLPPGQGMKIGSTKARTDSGAAESEAKEPR